MSTALDYDPDAAPDWGADALDVDAYLARIAHPPVAAPTAGVLRSLHAAHVRAIPFDNVDVLTGRHPGVRLPAVADKLVARRRGGYCFEHATLFAAVLDRLGYPLRRHLARVHPQGSGARTHMILFVDTDEGTLLADPGFGASMWAPMPLADGAEVDQAGWATRMVALPDGRWVLTRLGDDGWTAEHESADLPGLRPVDVDLAHHYTATGPDSPFVKKLLVKRLEPGMSTTLHGHDLTVRHAEGGTETRTVAPAEMGELLAELGLDLDEDEVAMLR